MSTKKYLSLAIVGPSLISAALLITGCPRVTSTPVTDTAPPEGDPAPEVVGAPQPTPEAEATGASTTCAPLVDRLWQVLARIPVDPPQPAATIDVQLPEGVTIPPRSGVRDGDCEDVGGIGALAAPGRQLRRCCSRAEHGHTEGFPRGCMMAFACHYELGEERAGTPTELAAMVGPVTTAGQALGLVALHHVEIVDPALVDLAGSSHFNFRGIPDAPPTFEVEPLAAGGFRVHAAAYSTCGCTHHVLRLTFDVTDDGCVSRVASPPEPIAHSIGVCID